MRRIDLPSSVRNVHSPVESGFSIDSASVEGDKMPHQALQSRRQTLETPSAFQNGTRVMFNNLIQSVSETAQLLIRNHVARPSRWGGRLLASLLVVAGTASTSFAQHQFPGDMDYTIPQNSYAIPDYSGSLNAQPARTVGGFGVMGRAGHEAGDTVGREGSLSYLDLAPFSFNGDTMFFGDGRLFVTNRGKMGGSVGMGVRHFFPSRNSILGTTFYYDHDESRGVTFEQFTVASELLTEFFDVRANVHLPFGNKQQVTGVRFEPGTQMFVDAFTPAGDVQGSNIAFQTRTFSSAALEGADLSLTTPIPGNLAERYNLEATAGGYHYQARGLGLQKITGFKLRLDGDFFSNLTHLSLEVTSDNAFDTNVVLGADINYWHHLEKQQRLGKSQYDRMASWVRRSRTVSTLDGSALDAPQLAINPSDGNPYLVYHVRNNPTPPPNNFPAPLGNGSLDMPFQYVQEALDAGPFADIVFVHANSVFDGLVDGNANATAVLREDVLVLGEGVPLVIPVQGIVSSIDLPTVTPGPANRPIFQNVTGPVITMANNSRFAGFQIQDYSDGPAVLFNGINRSQVDEVIIAGSTGALGSGIEINNSTGNILLQNITIDGTSGDAFVVSGGTAAITFNGTNSITNASGRAVFIEDAAGSVNMRSTTIVDTGGAGILVTGTTPTSSTANITFDQITLTNTISPVSGAFQVENHGGGLTVLNDMTIDSPGAGGITIQDLQPSGSVVFQGVVAINNRNDHGLLFSNFAEGPNPLTPAVDRAGSVTFQNNVNIIGIGGAPSLTPAIDMNTSSGTITLEDITIDGSLVSGIDISNLADTGTTTGRFISSGLTTILNTLDDSINIENLAKSDFQTIFNNVGITNRGASGIDIFNSASTTRFQGATSIDNQFGVTDPAIIIQQNTGDTVFNSVFVVNALGFFGVNVIDNVSLDPNDPSSTTFGSLGVEFAGVGAIAGQSAVNLVNNDEVGVRSGIIEATDARGVTVVGNGIHDVTFESVSATDADFGILVSDSIGIFHVTGLGAIAGSGGTIEGMAIDGAHFDNTQDIDLGFIDFEGNRVGVHGDTIIVEGEGISPSMILRGLTISDSLNEAVELLNVSDFLLLDSVLDNNGTPTGSSQVEHRATIRTIDIDGDGTDDNVVYNVGIINNDISDGGTILGTDMISIQTAAGIGAGAPLNLRVLNNGVPGNMGALNALSSNRTANMAALGIIWRGDLDAVIDSNTFLLDNGGGVGMIIDGNSNVTYSNNDLASNSAGTFGIDLEFDGATNLNIINNFDTNPDGSVRIGSGFLMNGVNSTAMRLHFGTGGNNVIIDSNLINMAGFDSTGIEFERIFAQSDVFINNNVIFLVTDFDTALEEGIVFRDVRGIINIDGTDNDVPLGTLLPFYIDFFMPAGTNNGQITVNGQPRP